MHPNYEYLLNFICRTHPDPRRGRFLDYGCGSAQVVMEGRRRGLEFFGADIFYAAGNARKEVEGHGLLGDIVREIYAEHLDFPDAYFDIVVNNQVFEHIENMDAALQEIRRVLKAGGVLLSVFPSREVIMEPHWGVPLLHWFPKRSRTRFYYTWVLRSVGFGYRKKDKPISEWTKNVCNWVDRFTFYRSIKEIDDIFTYKFCALEHIEDQYILFRIKRFRILVLLIRPLLGKKYIRSTMKRLSACYGSVVIKTIKENKSCSSGEKSVYEHKAFRGKGGINA